MSLYEENNIEQNIVLQIGPQLVFENVKQMKNTTKLNVTCCKSPTQKVRHIHVKCNYVEGEKCISHCDTGRKFMFDHQRKLYFPIN